LRKDYDRPAYGNMKNESCILLPFKRTPKLYH
jgi:hypothetical protein